MLNLYTDGACSNNGKKNSIGGWAFCIINERGEKIKEGYGATLSTTNNAMEYTAMLEGLKTAQKMYNQGYKGEINCFTDSALLYNTLTQWIFDWYKRNWTRKTGEIKNLDLIKQLYKFVNLPYINFIKVSAHSGNKWNEWCDEKAVYSRLKLEEVINDTNCVR